MQFGRGVGGDGGGGYGIGVGVGGEGLCMWRLRWCLSEIVGESLSSTTPASSPAHKNSRELDNTHIHGLVFALQNWQLFLDVY
jgi:hypothetical protein